MIGAGTNWFGMSDLYDFPDARAASRDAQAQIDDLRDRLDRMTLLSYAMWTLAREKLGVTDEQLADRVQELDLSDGKLDGKIGVPVTECLKCRRKMSQRHRRCIYCGTPR